MKASLERTVVARKTPHQVLSGAFVSQALQEMGVLPKGKDSYFLPMDFAEVSKKKGTAAGKSVKCAAQISKAWLMVFTSIMQK